MRWITIKSDTNLVRYNVCRILKQNNECMDLFSCPLIRKEKKVRCQGQYIFFLNKNKNKKEDGARENSPCRYQ